MYLNESEETRVLCENRFTAVCFWARCSWNVRKWWVPPPSVKSNQMDRTFWVFMVLDFDLSLQVDVCLVVGLTHWWIWFWVQSNPWVSSGLVLHVCLNCCVFVSVLLFVLFLLLVSSSHLSFGSKPTVRLLQRSKCSLIFYKLLFLELKPWTTCRPQNSRRVPSLKNK